MKAKTLITVVVILAVAMLGSVALLVTDGNNEASVAGTVVDEVTGELIGPWSNTIVEYRLSTKDLYDGSDVAAVAKVYDNKPSDWGNPRGTFDSAKDYTIYTALNGYVNINDEQPGIFYVVMTATGYNTEFIEISIPDGTGRGIDVAEYNAAPDVKSAPLAQLGATTDEDFAFLLVNDSSADLSENVNPKIVASTEFRAWKAIISDAEGFTTDTDGDGVYDEGIKRYEVVINGKSVVLFEPAKGIDEFDSNDEYTLNLEGITIADQDKLDIEVLIEGITGDFVGANDETWGEGEGVLSFIKVYDLEGSLFTTTDVTA